MFAASTRLNLLQRDERISSRVVDAHRATSILEFHCVHDLCEKRQESSKSGHKNHMQVCVRRSASNLEERAFPAALTREPDLGYVVEMHNCGNVDVDSLPRATEVRGFCKIPDVILNSAP